MNLITTHRQNNPNAEEEISKLGLLRTTLEGEYERTIEMFEQIYRERGLYFAIALLYDSGYKSEDLRNMMTIMENSSQKDKFIKPKQNG